ncbi:hypothetical protein HMPREF1624_06658 [Sporothrix schenckii ATCC 58251]|uniref:2-dehydropantoate 2-reductase n=1 Tax=Sporothrix schenckii (strain ATCC 58251 / de Perez 2211183) TaxID=1391915 RepID=U7PQV5_SPOS1|nr:hypothetical protein HMPREF1624_06658 [Sporothrix schenckii ATCC 58251]
MTDAVGADGPGEAAIPGWLSNVLQDKAPGPKIYKWTAEDIPGGSSTAKPVTSRKLSAEEEQRRIYILGMGNLGRLFAASLARLPNRPPITLVVHRPGLLEQWRSKPGVVLHPPSYLKDQHDLDDSARTTGFDVEMWSEAPPSSSARTQSAEISNIANLVISTKAQDALKTADWLRRYLGPDSAVAFAQNGMNKLWPPYGAVYNKARYPGTAAAPLWLACIVTHGVFSLGPFASVHASPADVVLGAVGDDSPGFAGEESFPYLVRQILAASQLNARWAPRHELWVLQLEKLVVNAVINPLTAILRCKNGALFVPGGESAVPQVIDELLQEASVVLRALVLHEMESGSIFARTGNDASGDNDKEALVERLSFASLRAMIYRVGNLVKDNNSSMLQDALAGKTTEVGEFNGWIVDMARYLESVNATDGRSIQVAAHEKMVDLVEKAVPLSKIELESQF